MTIRRGTTVIRRAEFERTISTWGPGAFCTKFTVLKVAGNAVTIKPKHAAAGERTVARETLMRAPK